MSFEPQELDITSVKGDRFVEELVFVEPGDEEKPVSIAAYTPELVIEGVATLTLTHGLLRPESNCLRILLTAAQSEVKDKAHWYLTFKEGSEDPETIFRGTWVFETR